MIPAIDVNPRPHEKRLISRLIAYWESLSPDGITVPSIGQCRIGDTDPDMWHRCILVGREVADGEPYYRYLYMGQYIIDAYKRDLTGGIVRPERVGHFPGRVITARLHEMSRIREPLIEQDEFANVNNELINYRCCIIPFCNDEDDDEITHMVLGVSWRVF